MTASAGGRPFADVSGRMEIFGRLFAEQVGVRSPATLPTPESLLALVQTQIPRSPVADDETPILEAAAYVGEWLRERARATWIAEGSYEPHLQLVDETHAIVYLLPLVQLLRTATSAGYDGMGVMLHTVLDDVSDRARSAKLDDLRVTPTEERGAVIAWVRENRSAKDATRAALWRRCSSCSKLHESAMTLHRPGDDWEGEAATAAALLAATPFECDCGGMPGAVTRFLMIRHLANGETHFGDIYVSNTHTRVGCWAIDGETTRPIDALALTRDEMLAG